MLLLFLLPTATAVSADDEKDERIKVDIEKFPELTCDKYGVFEGDNLVDPNNPQYNPSLKTIPRFKSTDNKKTYNKETPWPGEADWGTSLRDKSTVTFWQAWQKINTSITLPENTDTLFAPTLKGANGCRLESVAWYTNSLGTTYRYGPFGRIAQPHQVKLSAFGLHLLMPALSVNMLMPQT